MTSPTGSDGPAWPTHDPDAPPPDIAQSVEMRATVNRVNHIVSSAFGTSNPNGPAIDVSDSGGGAGSYYKLDPDQVRDYYGRLQKLADKAKSLQFRLQSLHLNAYPPAQDDASVKQAKASMATIQEAAKHLGGIISYASDYHDKLARSVHDYEKIEDENADDMQKAGNDADSGRAV